MEDSEKYGKIVFETTKDGIIEYSKKREKFNQKVYMVIFYMIVFSGLSYFFDDNFESGEYFYLLIFCGMAIFVLVVSRREKKNEGQIDYDNFYACIYEKGFVIKKSNDTKINIELSFGEIKKINRKVNKYNNCLIIDKKSGKRFTLDNKLIIEYIDTNIFYENLRRAFDKYQWETKKAEYYSK